MLGSTFLIEHLSADKYPFLQDPASEELLHVVRCKCKSSSKNQLGSTTNCSCAKNSLQCVSVCGECNGVGCYNSVNEVEDVADHIDDGNIFDNLF